MMGWAGWQEFQSEGGKFQARQRGTQRLRPPAPAAPARAGRSGPRRQLPPRRAI